MKLRTYLYVSKAQNVRLTKTPQAARPTEIRVEVQLNIPDAFFTRPTPVVNITIPPADAPAPIGEVVATTAEAVAQALQVNVEDVQDGLLEAINRKQQESDDA